MTIIEQQTIRAAGYGELTKRYSLEVIPNWHTAFVATSGAHRTETVGACVTDIYPASYWPGDSLGDHLEFALKYDGISLGILAAVSRRWSTRQRWPTGSSISIPSRTAMVESTAS